MFNLGPSLFKRTIIAGVFGDKGWAYFWKARFLPKWMPLFLGLGLGVILAFLITAQAWLMVVPLIILVPVVILLSRYPFAGVLFWILLTPFLVMPQSRADIYIFWILHRVTIPLTLIAALFPYLFKIKKEWPIRLGPAEFAVAAFMGVAVLATFLLSRNAMNVLYRIYDRVFIGFCLYFLMRLIAPREKELKLLLWVVVIQMIAQSTVGLLANFAPDVLPPRLYSPRAAERTIGTFNNTARYTSTLVFCLVVIYQASMHWKRGSTRRLLSLLFAWGALMVFLSFSKASWIGGILALIGILILYPGPMMRMALVLAILMAVFGVGLLSDQLAYAGERLQADSANQRMIANIAMFNMFLAKPFFGWGYGNLDAVMPNYVIRLDSFASKHYSSHNTTLATLAEFGGVGFFLYHFPFVWWLVLTLAAWRRMPKAGFMSRSFVAMLWLSVLNHFVIGNFSDFRTGESGIFVTCLWWATLGLIASLVDPYVGSDLVHLTLDSSDSELADNLL